MKKINFKKLSIFLLTTIFFISIALFAMADSLTENPFRTTSNTVTNSGGGNPVIENPLGNLKSIPTFVAQLLSYVVKIGGIIAIFAFIYSGFLFVKARGNPKELDTAKLVFRNTIIGVAVLLGAQLIASIIIGTIKNLKQ